MCVQCVTAKHACVCTYVAVCMCDMVHVCVCV